MRPSPIGHGAPAQKSMLTLLAGMLITGTLGSIHAFSVFVIPLEQSLGATRSQVSLIYSCGLVFLTMAVLAGHYIYRTFPPGVLAAGSCLVAAVGLVISAQAESLVQLWLGYSLVFGTVNGVGYGYTLQLVAQAPPNRKGFAMARSPPSARSAPPCLPRCLRY